MRRIHSQVDGQVGDALVGAGQTISVCFNLSPDLIKIRKDFPFAVKKLSIFCQTIKER